MQAFGDDLWMQGVRNVLKLHSQAFWSCCMDTCRTLPGSGQVKRSSQNSRAWLDRWLGMSSSMSQRVPTCWCFMGLFPIILGEALSDVPSCLSACLCLDVSVVHFWTLLSVANDESHEREYRSRSSSCHALAVFLFRRGFGLVPDFCGGVVAVLHLMGEWRPFNAYKTACKIAPNSRRCSLMSADVRCVRSCFICLNISPIKPTRGLQFNSQRRLLECFDNSPRCVLSVLSCLWSSCHMICSICICVGSIQSRRLVPSNVMAWNCKAFLHHLFCLWLSNHCPKSLTPGSLDRLVLWAHCLQLASAPHCLQASHRHKIQNSKTGKTSAFASPAFLRHEGTRKAVFGCN